MLVCDAAQVRDRPLDQAGHLIQQAGVVHHRQVLFRGEPGDAVGDDAFTIRHIDQNAVHRQLLPPVGGGGHSEGAGGMETMSLGQIAADKTVAVIGAVPQIERHDRTIQQAHDPAQRANPDKAAGASPTHGFRPREATQQSRHGTGDQLSGRDGGGAFLQHPVVALLAQLLAAGVVLAEEPRKSLFRRVGPRAPFDGTRGGNFGSNLGPQARCGGDRTSVAILAGRNSAEGSRDRAFKLSRRAALHAGGDFLAEQFNEEFGHQINPSAPARRNRFGLCHVRKQALNTEDTKNHEGPRRNATGPAFRPSTTGRFTHALARRDHPPHAAKGTRPRTAPREAPSGLLRGPPWSSVSSVLKPSCLRKTGRPLRLASIRSAKANAGSAPEKPSVMTGRSKRVIPPPPPPKPRSNPSPMCGRARCSWPVPSR